MRSSLCRSSQRSPNGPRQTAADRKKETFMSQFARKFTFRMVRLRHRSTEYRTHRRRDHAAPGDEKDPSVNRFALARSPEGMLFVLGRPGDKKKPARLGAGPQRWRTRLGLVAQLAPQDLAHRRLGHLGAEL
ncbi:hypothetical protein, partial [Xenophilus sp.]|uniref:hypothetical protein n=1 Tax=Xenophilus sp. TaxID=1873499 RepID=UPI0037DBF2BD